MDSSLAWILAPAILAVAVLYASVGHAGASGYIAVMALAGVAPGVLKPTALLLNIAVALIGTWQFSWAGHFSWRLFWPFAVLAVPASFVGGYVTLPTVVFKVLVGIVLVAAAIRLFIAPPESKQARQVPIPAALACGAALGLLAGLTGTGGGIFLTPLLLFAGWATTRQASGVSAPFILLNSAAGLAGNLLNTRHLDPVAAPLVIAAVLGGLAGSYLGSRRMPVTAMRRALAVVLVVAGGKLIFFH